MDTLKDKTLIIVAILMFFTSCNNSKITEIETFSNLDLKGKITFKEKAEKWNDFNGNGYKVMIYSIEDNNLSELLKISKEIGFKKYNTNLNNNEFTNSELKPYIGESTGLYKTKWKDNEIKTVIIDSTHRKLIYYYNIL